jgi:uroporphyrinogen decarboxylase
MEAFGKVHPLHRNFDQWSQMSDRERQFQRIDVADTYIMSAERYGHDAILVFDHPFYGKDEVERLLTLIRERSKNDYFLLMHGDPTYSMPDGSNMEEFTAQMYEEPELLHEQARKNLDTHIKFAERLQGKGLLDGFALCSDYCFNTNPYFSPAQFEEFVAPYLSKAIAEYRSMGYYSVKHTDGNIMPIIDQIIQCKPDALHSLDPQGGVCLAEMKKLYGDKVCLIGNVNCGLLQTGTEEEAKADVLRALREGMPGYGYVFGTSNCAYTGLPLERYEMMMELYREHGKYN